MSHKRTAAPKLDSWPEDPARTRHVLSLSGGKDSAALAVYLRDRVPHMEYIFHDTEKELPDTYEYLERLEGYLGKRIARTTFGTSFDKLLRVKGGMLPSNHRRWCTEYMKLKPFEAYIGDDYCFNYVGIRADEERIGYISHKPNIRPIFPFREDGIKYADVEQILGDSGLGLPRYTEWGRTRSGCFFCFYQQKIEWVRLKQRYPELYEQAKSYERPNAVNGNTFYWSDDEPLAEIEKPQRMLEIEEQWRKTQERLEQAQRHQNRTLAETFGGLEAKRETRRGCLICQL